MGGFFQRQGLGEFHHLARGEGQLVRAWVGAVSEADLFEPIRAAAIIRRRLIAPRRVNGGSFREMNVSATEILRSRDCSWWTMAMPARWRARGAQHDRRSFMAIAPVSGQRRRRDPHQRGLAGAVLADQPHDFIQADRDRRVVQRPAPGQNFC